MVSSEIASFITSPIVGNLAQKIGRKNIIMIGYVIIVGASAGLAFTGLINSAMTYFGIAIVCRFF
jgi:MFS family permease